MQLYALDSNQQLTPAIKAKKSQNYVCLECQGLVRVRAGNQRQVHYFHFRASSDCKLSGKSLIHLQVQIYLQSILPLKECWLERRFPAINRIADVVWEPQKLIFEVQCSAISAEEVLARQRDYASLGYQVIWILHDQLFNQYRLSLAEWSLIGQLFYFTNINKEGQGLIYDQFDQCVKGVRQKKLGPLAVDLLYPCFYPELNKQYPLLTLNQRLKKSLIYFRGDLTDQFYLDTPYFHTALSLQTELSFSELKHSNQKMTLKTAIGNLLDCYRIIFQHLLERICK